MSDRLRFLGVPVRMGVQIGRERLTRPRPASLRQVPPSPESFTDAWLTLALCDGVPGARVVSHELGPRDDGTSSRRALRIEFNAEGKAAGLTADLFTKSGPTYATRVTSVAADLGLIESSFYRQVRPLVDIEAPRAEYAAFDPLTGRSMVIVDDLAVTRGARFGTILSRQLTREQAEQVVDLLATLHSTFWQAPVGRRYGSWLMSSYDWMARLNVTINASVRLRMGFERAGQAIDPAFSRRSAEVPAAMMRALELNTTGPQTLLHGDVHPGNWYETGAGRMGLYDWQCVVSGGWARDLAYALSTHLTVDQRRSWERDLVARHSERLAEAGCAAPDAERAFTAYRQQMLHAVFMWVATIGHYRFLPKLQPADIALESARRACQAAADLDTLAAIDGRPTVHTSP